MTKTDNKKHLHHQQFTLSFESNHLIPSNLVHGDPHECQKPEDFVVATWNVNSIRARLDLVVEWLKTTQPDVLCLQEIKVSDDLFPAWTFAQLGYHSVVHGQRRCNGVAILSRHGFSNISVGLPNDNETEARIVAASIQGLRVASIYAPNAYSITDPSFSMKLDWLGKLADYVHALRAEYGNLLLCGDFNVAPRDSDLHDPSLWLYSTFVHAAARNALRRIVDKGLMDLHMQVNRGTTVYTWWDYRNDAVSRNNGIRIDHVYATKELADRCIDGFVDVRARKAAKPSDHAPLVFRFKLRNQSHTPNS
jgi:exodeoxyribonuclease III